MEQLKDKKIVGHIHDELIIECLPTQKLDEVSNQVSNSPNWMGDINLRAEGYECYFYQKD